MDHDEKAKLLLDAMSEIELDPVVTHAFNELAYTAYETGVIEVKLYNPLPIIQLVKLAEKFRDQLPNQFKM